MRNQPENILDLVIDKLGKPYKDLSFLLQAFKDVLIEISFSLPKPNIKTSKHLLWFIDYM